MVVHSGRSSGHGREIEIRPRLTPYFAYAAAVIIATSGIILGVLLKISSTGVIFLGKIVHPFPVRSRMFHT